MLNHIRRLFYNDPSTRRRCLFGIGYGTRGVPIELAQILLAGRGVADFHLFIVDEFQRLNGRSEQDVEEGRRYLDDAIDVLATRFGVAYTRSYASELLHTQDYRRIHAELQQQITTIGLTEELLATVPSQHRCSDASLSYPAHELACVRHFATQGYEAKLGPTSELKYDSIMRRLGFPITFRYLADAFALGVQEDVCVVHYVPHAVKGQRVYMHDTMHQVRAKLLQANENALCSLANIALAAAEVVGETPSLPHKPKARRLAVAELLSHYVLGVSA